MSEYFWESVQKARKEHFCDWCCNWIQPGEVYTRRIWAPRGTRSFHVMREHDTPGCPPNIGEEIAMEMMREERAALGVPIMFVAEQRQVLKVGLSGETIVESETHFTPKLVCEAVPRDDSGFDDEEIPF